MRLSVAHRTMLLQVILFSAAGEARPCFHTLTYDSETAPPTQATLAFSALYLGLFQSPPPLLHSLHAGDVGLDPRQ